MLQVNALVVGEVIRPPMFVATSFNKQTARSFAKNARYLVRVAIPAHSMNACCVREHSEFAEEEVLIPPYSPFRVLLVDHATRTIRLELLDGKVYGEFEMSEEGVHAQAKPL